MRPITQFSLLARLSNDLFWFPVCFAGLGFKIKYIVKKLDVGSKVKKMY